MSESEDSETNTPCYSFGGVNKSNATEKLTSLITEGVNTIAIGWNYNEKGKFVCGEEGIFRLVVCHIEKGVTTIGPESFGYGEVPLKSLINREYSMPIDSRNCSSTIMEICEKYSLEIGNVLHNSENKFKVSINPNHETINDAFLTLVKAGQLDE